VTPVTVLLTLAALASADFVCVLLADGLRALRLRRRLEAAKRPIRLVVSMRENVGENLFRLVLQRPDRSRLPAFAAGQHIVLIAPAGRNGRSIRRAYSLAAWKRRPRHYELGIKREDAGAFSSWAHAHLLPGVEVEALPPRGDFELRRTAGETVLIGGGIGITPMRAMAQRALAAAGGGRVVLFHSARRPQELMYREDFERLAATRPGFRYIAMVSRPDADWTGHRGRLDAPFIVSQLTDPQRASIHMCASTSAMQTLQDGLLAAGIGPDALHLEAFGAAAAAGACGIAITLDDSPRIETAGEPTLLATLENAECAPPSECRAGHCGLCRMRLLEGEVEWLLPPPAGLPAGDILPCICRPTGPLRIATPASGSDKRRAA
jgi:ferredoxin-NADP reductase